jgi:hypothetical protein
MKAQAVGYWICTVLIGLSFLSAGAVHQLRPIGRLISLLPNSGLQLTGFARS